LGHKFKLINLQEFGFDIKDNKLDVVEFRNIDCDLVIVRGIFLAIKTISALITSLRDKGVKVFDNNFLEHRYSIDKVTDLVKLSIAGVATPNTSYARDYTHYTELAGKIGYPVIVKSSRMGKGVNVFKFDDEAELVGFINESEEKGLSAKSFIIQEFIPYIYDLRILIVGESVFTMRRIPASGEFRANFSLGGDVELYDLDEKGEELAKKALKAVDMSVGGVDMLITDDDKRCILEVNHTAGFVGMEKATGKNIGKIFVKHAIAEAK
jgi:RimK family alpha-L-glutamate ligase